MPIIMASLSSRQACTLRPLVQAAVMLEILGMSVPSGCMMSAWARGASKRPAPTAKAPQVREARDIPRTPFKDAINCRKSNDCPDDTGVCRPEDAKGGTITTIRIVLILLY